MLDSHPLPSPKLGSFDPTVDLSGDVLVLGVSSAPNRSPSYQNANQLTNGGIDRLINSNRVSCKVGDCRLLASPVAADGPKLIILLGLDSESELDRASVFNMAATAVRSVSDLSSVRIDFALSENINPSLHDALVAGALNACENQSIYQSDPSVMVPEEIRFSGVSESSIQRGTIIGQSLIQTRRLVNEPPAMLYPESFASRASELAAVSGLSIEVWDEKKLEAEGCRAILAVGAGSVRPPRMVILRYNGGGDQPPIAFVGKGVTFDSGGLSIKPSDSMADMKCDMAGAATVVGLLSAVARLGVKQNVIGFCGLAENMISGTSYKLGDVIETRSGKTIEILNTDAEGRVVLADTLDVAVQAAPSVIIDLATLTGACMVALGTEVVGMMTNHQWLCDRVASAAEAEGEPTWQLPMFELYDEQIKSKVADIKNVGQGRWGGAITAAKFLENFVGDTPWLHLDIAGPAFADSPKPHRDAGATGVMLRSLLRIVETLEPPH